MTYQTVSMTKREQSEQTRKAIIETAANLIHRKGFMNTSLDEIIGQIGLTKGAFFHHFSNKKELGFAIIDYWKQNLYEKWVMPLESSDDPLRDLYEVPRRIYGDYTMDDVAKGCPLANLATELSPLDEDLRLGVLGIYRMLEEGVASALRRGQELGTVRSDVDAILLARFYEDLMAGTRSVAKNTLDKGRIMGTIELFKDYLESQRV